MALEKGLPCISALCQSWTKAGWNEATGEGEARVMLWEGRSFPWALLGIFYWLLGEGSHEKLGEKQFGGVRSDLCALPGHSH